ncbi:hypothetical protein KP806_16070 [Paenibacillus sp. N4]|uniref:alpha/beta hydrolase family protein n=1 Tax=Paenibacillus vietnamensis TaxID=2590547 RepID=UPI001CD0B58D|nr:hypothetical protein [Paenibacillus vietnamensis]MCA0756573.1 hypothetical protein [Paenibacillus vietnamensis]
MKLGKRVIRLAISVLLLLLLLAVSALYYFLPTKLFEKPTGPYEVGTVTRYLEDSTRRETFTADPGDRRELFLQIWYPAADNDLPRANYGTYMPQLIRQMAESMDLPSLLLRHLTSVKTYSSYNAEPAGKEASYPVLLFSHGLGLYGFQNTFQMEELASHGYIVVSIQHPYQSLLTVFPDGREIAAYPFELASFGQFHFMNKIVTEVMVKDGGSALDYLERIRLSEGDDSFAGRADLSRVGMLGHSIGGAAAAQALLLEPRMMAALNLDGTLTGTAEIPAAGFSKPFMQLAAQPFEDSQLKPLEPDSGFGAQLGVSQAEIDRHADFLSIFGLNQSHAFAGGGYYVWLKGASHYTFTDVPLYSPLVPFMLKDKIKTKLAHRIINDYTLAFFNQALKYQPSPLLQPSESDTVKVTVGLPSE